MNINAQQHEMLLRRLLEDYDFKDVEGEYFSRGICPECGKRELFISKEHPWRLCCNRRNKCGFSASTFELYRHSLFADWSTYYRPSQDNPNATADAYMQYARGFALEKVRSLYSQEYYCGHKSEQRSATVRFTLCDGKARWERLIDNTDRFAGQKGRALGSYKGLWWQMPDADFDQAETVWITEGIFDALSLIHAGYMAIASISCGHYPDGFFTMLRERRLNPTIIFALDNDHAGREGIRKHVAHARQDGWRVKAAMPPPRHDWNDLWREGKLDEHAITEARYRGDLLVAESAAEKARIMYRKSGMNSFPLTFGNRTYWFALDLDAYQNVVSHMEEAGTWHEDDASRDEALQQAGAVTEIANCTINPLYFQRDRYKGNEALYFVRITRPHGADVQDTFTGSHIGAAADFKKRLLSIAPGALYEGNAKQLNRIIKTDFVDLRMVETIDYTGYVRELDAWVYRDFAVCNGRVIRCNDEQFVALDGQRSIKTISDINIHLADETAEFDWLQNFLAAFAERGLVALAFFTGSLFVDQIRQQQKSWPFLEITGDAGTGKTTLIEFLWRLLGRSDYEGFDPGKSSAPGRARSFNKVSGMPVVLIESDHSANSTGNNHFRKFEFGELKDLYNGRPIYTRGAKTGGLETYDPPFRASIVIAQNNRVEADEAVLSRIVPLLFTRKNLQPGGKAHVDALIRLPIEKLATYLTHILRRAKTILADYFAAYPACEERLLANTQITMSRIAQNGAQMMAMLQAVAKQIGLDEATTARTLDFVEQISVERQQSMVTDHPMVSEFWDSVEYLESINGVSVNHHADPGLLAINLPHVEACARASGIQLPPRTELNRLLDKSVRYEFLGRRTVRSKLMEKNVKCLVFKNIN